MPISPRIIRTLAGLLAAGTILTLAWGAVITFGSGPAVWGMFGFEVVIAASATVGVFFSMNALPHAPALTLSCIALGIFVSAGLGLVATGLLPGPVLRHPLFLTRFALVAGFAALAVVAALGESQRSWRMFFRGGALAGVSAGALLGGYRLMGTISLGPGIGQLLLIIVSVLGAVVLMGALCVGAHMLIRAFEIAADGAPESDGAPVPSTGSPKPSA